MLMYGGKIKNECEDDCENNMPFDSNRVYTDQLSFREIMINGDISQDLIEKAIVPIMNYNRYDDQMSAKIKDYQREPIKIFINSSGGLIDECMALVSIIGSSKTPIHTVVLGKAYSAGFLILIAGHERYMQRYSRVMLHPGSGGYVGSFPGILKHANEIFDLQEQINGYIVNNTFIDPEEIEDMTRTELNWYMQAPESLCRGVVDYIIMEDRTLDLEGFIEEQKKIEKDIKQAKKAAKSVKGK